MKYRYVTPNKSVPCLTDQHPCLTIDEYASQIDKFFHNDSIFNFGPGNHSLNIGLNISGIHNVSFIGLPNNSVTIEVLKEFACITWEDCTNIEISNITFSIGSNFFFCILSFKLSSVKISYITVHGNKNSGCSVVISIGSTANFSATRFINIVGYYGATLMALNSNISFEKYNDFARNTAQLGGAMYLMNSTVLFSGTNHFSSNLAKVLKKNLLKKCRKKNSFHR